MLVFCGTCASTRAVGESLVSNGHTVSVIISSYNHPNCLRLVLEGFAAQEQVDFEVIIADDGSESDTFELVEEFDKRGAFPLRIVTQPDEGFRKARALNGAILEAKGDQLIFSDGDCVPFPNYVKTHRAAYNRMGYCVGGYIFLTLEEAQALTPEEVARGEHQRFLTSRARARLAGVHWRNQLYKLLRKPRKPKILGGNFSVGREAIYAINGLDERIDGFSGEDTDVRTRLNNLGAKRVSLWNSAYTCHLDHELDPRRCTTNVVRKKRDRSLLIENRAIVRTPAGFAEHSTDR